MAEPKTFLTGGVTPIKFGLVVVLSVVLIGVLVIQFSGSEPVKLERRRPLATDSSDRAATRKKDTLTKSLAANTSVPQPAAALPSGSTASPRQVETEEKSTSPPAARTLLAESDPGETLTTPAWPQLSLEDVLQHNPFALPARLVVHREEQRVQLPPSLMADRDDGQTLTALQQDGVGMVYIGRTERLAKIGTRTVRVGDEIDGFVVTEIGPDGVVLAPQPVRSN